MPDFNYIFKFENKDHKLGVTAHKGSQYFDLYIDNFFYGRVFKDKTGKWVPLDKKVITDRNRKNIWFELQSDDFDIIGEMIEEKLPEITKP